MEMQSMNTIDENKAHEGGPIVDSSQVELGGNGSFFGLGGGDNNNSSFQLGNEEEEEEEDENQAKMRPHLVYHRDSFYDQNEDNYALDATFKKGSEYKKSSLGTPEQAGGDEVKMFGTLYGVFLPCLQNILGVILFVRLPWIVGQAGMLLTTVIVMICVCCTGLTTLSMSALATNGKIKAGGPYAILLSNLGPEFAGSIGVLFYLGTTIAASMYALGGVEAMITNFFDGEQVFPFDKQVFSIGWTILLGMIVFAGMKYVAKVALIFLMIVLSAIVLMSLGTILFAAGVWDPPGIDHTETLGENLYANFVPDAVTGVTPDFTFLIALFFPSVTGIMAGSNRSGVLSNPGRSIPKGTLGAIGVTTSIYIWTVYLFGFVIARKTLLANKLVASFIAWPHQYVVAVGIIMSTVGAGLQSLAGAPQLLKSIANEGHIPFLRVFSTANPNDEPRKAVVFTTCIASVVCLAGNLDYITPIITMFFLCMYGGVNFACFLVAFLGAPNFRPTWRYFHWSTALLGFLLCLVLMFVISTLYAFIALLLVIGIFLYVRSARDKKEWGDAWFGLRLDQALNALIDLSAITERQRRYATLAKKMQKPQEQKQQTVWEWWSWFCCRIFCGRKRANGDIESQGDFSVEKSTSDVENQMDRIEAHLEEEDSDLDDLYDENEAFLESSAEPMKKNWRPQILVLCKMDEKVSKSKKRMTVSNPSLLKLASQLKKGKGLVIAQSIIHGDIQESDSKRNCILASRGLGRALSRYKVRGFTDVIVGSGPSLLEPMRVVFQTKGLGMLSPNTVMLAWPKKWRLNTEDPPKNNNNNSTVGSKPSKKKVLNRHKEAYVRLLKDAISCQKALIVVKNEHRFPSKVHERRSTIDVWWLIHDGDMLVLIPYLLQRHKVWADAVLRIFAIADDLVDFSASRQILANHLQELRISAKIEMIHVGASHARDVDQNRTIAAPSPARESAPSILSPNLFQKLPDTIEVVDGSSGHGGEELLSPTNNSNSTNNFNSASASTPTKTGLKPSSLVKSLSRRRGSGSGRNLGDNQPAELDQVQLHQEFEKIAQHIANSAGEETQRWIQEKYSKGDSSRLSALFAPIKEGVNTEEDDEEDEDEGTGINNKAAPQLPSINPSGATQQQQQQQQQQKPQRQHMPTESSSTLSTISSGEFVPTEQFDLEMPFNPDETEAYQVRQYMLDSKARDTGRLQKRLKTAQYLNKKIVEHSKNADLVVLNLPLSRLTPTDEFISYTEQLTDGLKRVIMLRGHGTENVTSLS